MPAKTTAAKTAAPAKKESAPVAINFDALTVQDVDAEELKQERGSNVDNTPVKGWLAESKASGKAKAVPLPNKAQADAFVVLLRSAAARLKIGVKILVTDRNGNRITDETSDNAQRIVKFLGKEKRAYDAEKAAAKRAAKARAEQSAPQSAS
jgi:hypothetical protein